MVGSTPLPSEYVPGSRMLERIKKDCRVEIVDDERCHGNGVLITLRRGWTFDPLQDNRVAGEDTVSEAARLLTRAKPFAGPYID